MLPTPNPFHLKNTETPEEWRARRADVKRRTATNLGMPLPVAVQLLPTPTGVDATSGPGGHRGGGPNLRTVAGLLPTPTAQDAANTAGPSQHRRHSLPLNTVVTTLPELGIPDQLDPPGEQLAIPMPGEEPTLDWGPYTEAVDLWAGVLGRPAPVPLVDGKLSALFVEWCMGLPLGWVTDVPGLTRVATLRMLGNGVVPQQAARAFLHLGILDNLAPP